MSEEQFIFYTKEAMLLILYLSLPVVITATVIGLLAGLFQALTQIQDQTLAFGLKLVGVIFIMLLTATWMGQELLLFADKLYSMIALVP